MSRQGIPLTDVPAIHTFHSRLKEALYQLERERDRAPCITCEIPGKMSCWIQIVESRVAHKGKAYTLNFAYPFSENPLAILSQFGIRIPSGSQFVSWEQRTFATLDVPREMPSEDLLNLITRILVHVQGVSSLADVKVFVEHGY